MRSTTKALSYLAVALLVAAGLPAAAEAEAEPVMMSVIAGNGSAGFADGNGDEARFNKPIRLAPWGPGAVLVADIYNHSIRIVHADGHVETLVGGPDRQGHTDGPAATARISSPHGVAVSADGTIAVAEAENHTIRLIRRVDGDDIRAADGSSAGYVVSTLAGAPGTPGMADGPALEARFSSPHAVIWAPDGALWVADIGNARVRRIDDGQVSTVAGGGDDKASEGLATAMTLHYPMDLALDADGSLLIADAGSHEVRRLTADGRLQTLPQERPLETPHGITVDDDGHLYVAEIGGHRVVRLEPSGALTTAAGTGLPGVHPTQLDDPAAVLAHDGLLWIADLGNHRITAVPLACGQCDPTD